MGKKALLADMLEPGVLRILAPNPSPMTGPGTNTYVIGHDEVVILDPGPANAGHLENVAAAAGDRVVRAILVSHAHLDHSEGARALSEAVGCPIFGFGPPTAGRLPVMDELAAQGLMAGGEGVDPDFTPDHLLCDGDMIALERSRDRGPVDARPFCGTSVVRMGRCRLHWRSGDGMVHVADLSAGWGRHALHEFLRTIVAAR